MIQNQNFISVVIPVYNGENFLAQAVDHILVQNYQPLEIIVIDDGSTDNTVEVAAQLQDKIHYFYQENSGPAAARNLGIKQAKGELIAFLDVDDRWSNNTLKILTEYLKKHPESGIAQGLIIRQKINPITHKVIENSPPYNYINLGCALYRKSTFQQVGLFDETMRYGEDVDWYLRAWEQRINKGLIDEVTLYYRMHDTNMTKGKNLIEKGFIRIYKKRLDRMRKEKVVLKPLPRNFLTNQEYLGGEPLNHLDNPKFTLISNNGWSNMVYRRLNYLYQTPFVGTQIPDHCYSKLLSNLRHYLKSALKFIPETQYSFTHFSNENEKPIIGLLGEDIEIHFYQENTEEEVLENWQKRLTKINWDNLYACYCCSDRLSKAEQDKYLQEFERLDLISKVAFTAIPYPQYQTAIYLPEYTSHSYELFKITAKNFGIIDWLNKTRGYNTQEYLVVSTQNKSHLV